MSRISAERRFWSFVDRGEPNECWPWLGGTNNVGYGVVHYNGKHSAASKVAYQLAVGPVPDGLVVCHRCDNRICTNPAHLFLGTMKDNMQDMVAKGRQRVGQPRVRTTTPRMDKRKKIASESAPLLANFLERHSMTQVELARRMGMSHEHINRVINGKRPVAESFIARFAFAFGPAEMVQVFGSPLPHCEERQ